MSNASIMAELLKKIRSGKAILFAGADFSKDSFNCKGKKLPLPKELSKEICKLGSFSPSEDLIYTSERYLTENEEKGDKEKLIQLLRSNYEVEIPSESSKNILKSPWNKFYTTNYDDTLEKIDREIIPVDLSSSLDKVEIKDKRCVHINGFIKKLSLESLEKSFKLTESSYLSSKGFLESPWYTVFKRDLERCSALVFVGYSLYDMDIKRILVNIENLKDNTYFIVKDKILEKEEFLFKKFGTIIKIGVENFSDLISNTNFITNNDDLSNLSIKRYEYKVNSNNVCDLDTEKLSLFGLFNQDLLKMIC